MALDVVRPSKNKNEILIFCLVIFIIIGLTLFLTEKFKRNEHTANLKQYQISGYRDLNPIAQGISSDLYTAVQDIGYLSDNGWPTVKELEEAEISPFVKDQSWEKRGRLNWVQLQSNSLNVIYIGKPMLGGKAGAFLFQVSKNNNSQEDTTYHIWHSSQNNINSPEKIDVKYLTSHGWKEIIPYKGEDEIIRLKGDEYKKL